MQGEGVGSASGRRATPTRTYLLRFALALVVPLLLFVAFLFYESASRERSRVEQRALTLALHISRIVDSELSQRIALLDGLAASQALLEGDFERFQREAQRAAPASEVIILRELGPRQYVNTGVEWGQPLPDGIPMTEQQQALLRAGQPYVGNVYAAPRDGEARVVVARSVLVNGETRVLGLTMPTEKILKVVLENGTPGWVIGIGDAVGNYVTRSSQHEEVTGRPGLDSYLKSAQAHSGTFYLDNVRGRPILAGYVKSPFSQWLYAANIDYAEVLAPQRLWLSWLAAMAAATLATSVAVAFYFGRKYAREAARLAVQAGKAGDGDWTLPEETSSDVAEFAVIGEALVRGRQAMAEREREKERSREREAFLASIFDSTGLQVGIVELDGNRARLVVANKSAMRLFASALSGTDGGSKETPGREADLVAMMQSAQQLQVPVEGEFRLEVDGRTHHFLGTFTRLDLSRIAFTCVDITAGHLARQIADARSRELELVLSTVPAGVWFTYDIDARRVIRNRYANEVLRDLEPEVVDAEKPQPKVGRFAFFTEGKAVSAEEMPLRHAMRGGSILDREYEIRYWDGSVRALLMSASPLRDEKGEITGAVCVGLDITGRKRDEDQKQLLLNELNHRVKNTLATIQSIAGQTLRNAPTKEVAQQILTQRLVALAHAHDVLTRENWEGAYMRDIVGSALAPYPDQGRFDLRGSNVWLTPGLSLTFAMALHELMTNAIKHGALSSAAGRVSIDWDVALDNGRRLHFLWREHGGPPVTAPDHKGFGLRLLERSFAGGGGEVSLEYAAEGLSCSIVAALDPRGRSRSDPAIGPSSNPPPVEGLQTTAQFSEAGNPDIPSQGRGLHHV